MAKLIVGLGNPGIEYELTRHNIGWQIIDALPFSRDLVWKEKFKGEFALYSFEGEQFVFLKPQTYMNLSGESVVLASTFYKTKIEETLVIHDELDLDYGTVALKKGGGLAGHNGLKSIAQSFGGNTNFLRLRAGIGRPDHGNVSSYVLSPYSKDEDAVFGKLLEGASRAVELYMKEGFDKAAGRYSRKKLI